MEFFFSRQNQEDSRPCWGDSNRINVYQIEIFSVAFIQFGCSRLKTAINKTESNLLITFESNEIIIFCFVFFLFFSMVYVCTAYFSRLVFFSFSFSPTFTKRKLLNFSEWSNETRIRKTLPIALNY